MRYFLLVPFIVLPILISEQFMDPTLLIRRTSLFVLLSFIILLFFLFGKLSINKISNLQTIYIRVFIIFILYILISSWYTAINFRESIWGIIYLIGWFGVFITFFLYANQTIMHRILVVTSICGGILSLLSLMQAYNLFQINNFSSTSSTFINRNFWGMYLCFVIPSSIFSIVISKINRNKLIHILLFSFSLCSLIHCRARAAWVALFISFILLLLIHHKSIFSFILNFSDNKTIFQSLSIIPLILILFIYFEPDV